MKGTTIFWSFVGVFFLGACLYLWFGAEWIEEEIDRGYSVEARRNDFLAAEKFLGNKQQTFFRKPMGVAADSRGLAECRKPNLWNLCNLRWLLWAPNLA